MGEFRIFATVKLPALLAFLISSHTSCFYGDYGIYPVSRSATILRVQENVCTFAIAINSDYLGRFPSGFAACKRLRARGSTLAGRNRRDLSDGPRLGWAYAH